MDGTDVAIITPPCHRDVTVRGHAIVCGIEIDPIRRLGTTPNTRHVTHPRPLNAAGQAAAAFADSR